MIDAQFERSVKVVTKEDFAAAALMIDDNVKGLFKAHVQTLKDVKANGRATEESGLSLGGQVKVVKTILRIWSEDGKEDEKLKIIKSLVFIDHKFAPAALRMTMENSFISPLTPSIAHVLTMTSRFCPSTLFKI